MARVITVNDILDPHVALDIECLDRIYLNGYVPILQTISQVWLHVASAGPRTLVIVCGAKDRAA